MTEALRSAQSTTLEMASAWAGRCRRSARSRRSSPSCGRSGYSVPSLLERRGPRRRAWADEHDPGTRRSLPENLHDFTEEILLAVDSRFNNNRRQDVYHACLGHQLPLRTIWEATVPGDKPNCVVGRPPVSAAVDAQSELTRKACLDGARQCHHQVPSPDA